MKIDKLFPRENSKHTIDNKAEKHTKLTKHTMTPIAGRFPTFDIFTLMIYSIYSVNTDVFNLAAHDITILSRPLNFASCSTIEVLQRTFSFSYQFPTTDWISFYFSFPIFVKFLMTILKFQSFFILRHNFFNS